MNYTKDLQPLEFGIIGRALMKPEEIGELAALIRADDFAEPTARSIWKTITDLFYEGRTVDEVTVNLQLGGGYTELLKAAKSEAVSSNMYHGSPKERARQLSEAARRRRIIDAATAIALAQPDEDLTGKVETLAGMSAERGGRKVWSALDAVNNFLDRHGDQKATEYLRLGLDELDRMLYLERGDFVVLGGYPSAGKTALATQFAARMAEKFSVGFFSLETSPEKLTDRIAAQMSRIPFPKIKKNELTESDWEALTHWSQKAARLKLEQIPAAGMSVADIKAYTLRGQYDVIFVDYLQLLRGDGRDRYEQVTNISQQIHNFSQAHGVLVIALAQLSRPEKTGGKPLPPTMHSFREAGQIEQDADAAILLYLEKPNDYKSRRVLKLAKNKEGERTQFLLDFMGEYQTFRVANVLADWEGEHELIKEPKLTKKQQADKEARERAEAAPMFQPVKDDGPLPF